MRLVSQYSGRTIRLNPDVHGKINLASIDPLSPDEIFILFQKSLQERGLILRQSENNEYQVKFAETSSNNLFVTPGAVTQQEFPQSSESADRISPSVQLNSSSDSDTLLPSVAKHRYVTAIFASKERALSISSRLQAAGAEVEVLVPNNPADKDFSIVPLYRDSAEGYQAIASAIQQAGLSGLISMPAPPAAVPVREE